MRRPTRSSNGRKNSLTSLLIRLQRLSLPFLSLLSLRFRDLHLGPCGRSLDEMEPANIDWNNIESQYVKDELYEHINAPKWLDLAAPDSVVVDDDAWFCRPDCRHPKTAEDFQRMTPSPKVKLLRTNSEAFPQSERNIRNQRDAPLKRRGGIGALLPSSPFRDPLKPRAAPKKYQDDLENQNPNVASPCGPIAAPMRGKTAKDAIKSSAEKGVGDEGNEELQCRKPQPKLRSTLSARNLFSGRDILGQISEFCNELKKMAMRKERNLGTESTGKKEEEEKKALLTTEEENGMKDQNLNPNLNSKKNNGSVKKSSRMALRVETENAKENHNNSHDENPSVLREVRAWPPTPQRFPSPSSARLRKAKAFATTNSSLNKPPKAAPERGLLHEMIAKDESGYKNATSSDSPNVEGKSDSVFWFLKPCSYLV